MKTGISILLLFVLFTAAVMSVSAQTVLNPQGNVYVKGGTAADSNYYFDNLLRVRGAASNLRKSYLKFDIHEITQNIVKAELKITINRVVAITGGILNRADIFAVDTDTWDEQTVTWNNAPARGAYLFTQEFLSKTSTQPDTDYVLDVTNYVRSQYQGDKVVSLCMVDTLNVGSDIRFWSNRNLLATGPQLIISTGSTAAITVTAPNGGETWAAGTQHNITWNSNLVSNVKIEYTTNNGGAWLPVAASTPAAAGTYSWTVPNTTSINCKVRVSDASNASLLSVSQSVFTIYDPAASLNVTTPNGGENWTVGSERTITWTGTGVNFVRIEYTTNNGAAWYLVANNIPAASGAHPWMVPFPPSTQCKIKINDVAFPNINDVSNGTFTIADLPNTVFPAAANVYVKAGTAADSNYAADTLLRVRGSTDVNTQRKTYLRFNLTGFSGTVAKAYLHVIVNRVVAITGGLINRSDIFGVSDDAWDQSTLTWNNSPARGAYLFTQEFSARTSTQGDTLYRLDVTSYVQSELSGNKLASFCLVDTLNNGTDVRFWSTRPNAAIGPALVLYTATDAEENITSLPESFSVAQNFPNPFNPATTVAYGLMERANVSVKVYDVLGTYVATLFEGEKAAGQHTAVWNGKAANGSSAASGLYFCTVSAGQNSRTIKMMLNK